MASRKSKRRRDKRRRPQPKPSPAPAELQPATGEQAQTAVEDGPEPELEGRRKALTLDWRDSDFRPIDEGMPTRGGVPRLLRLRDVDEGQRFAAIALIVFCFIGLVVNSMLSLLLMAAVGLVVIFTDLRYLPALRRRTGLAVISLAATYGLLQGNGDLEIKADMAGSLFTAGVSVTAALGFWLLGDTLRRVADLRFGERFSLPLFALGAANCTVATVIAVGSALFLSTAIPNL